MTLIDDIRVQALGQGGALTTKQCFILGASATDLVRFVQDGLLRHPFRGAYTLPEASGVSAQDDHLVLCHAAQLIYPAGVLGGVSAVLAYELPDGGADLAKPVMHHGKHRGVGVKGIVLRRERHHPPVESEHGRTLPLAVALIDMARDHGVLAGVMASDAALHQQLVSVQDLEAALKPVRDWPKASLAAAMLTHIDGRSESPGESWTRFQLSCSGIETIPQVEIRDAFGQLVARVDLLVAGTKVVVEFDGKVKYATGDGEVLWAEKKREDTLRRLGYVVVRVTWGDLHRPGCVASMVRQALAAA